MTQRIVKGWLTDTLNRQGLNFFDNVINVFGSEKNHGTKPKVIASAHFYESSIPEILTLPKYSHLVALIPKNSSATRYPGIVQFITESGLPIANVDKDALKDSKKAIEFVKSVVEKGPFYISDHGGYFARAASRLCKEFKKSAFLGFTEYTHNGHKRYEKHADGIDRPVISVAELALKSPADREAGETVAHVVDNKLRQVTGLKVANTRKLVQIGIIGYGRLGESAAKAFTGRGVKEIWIADSDINKLTKAAREEFVPRTIEDICRNCNVIISATGSAAIKPHHYEMMKDGVMLATVTSPDDELDKDSLMRDGVLTHEQTQEDVASYKIGKTKKRLHLIADGEAANSLCKSGIGDPTLYLPQAAQIVANLYLEKFSRLLKPGVQELPHALANRISQEWLRHFYDYNPAETLPHNPWEELKLTVSP